MASRRQQEQTGEQASAFGAFARDATEEEFEEEEEEEEMEEQEEDMDGPRGISGANASRLLEALEALSNDSQAHGFPQMLRGLFGQLQVPSDAPTTTEAHEGSLPPPPSARNESSLRQLSGFFPVHQLFEGNGNPRYQQLLRGLQPGASMANQMESLSELCESLSLTTEELLTLSNFDVHSFTTAIVGLIRSPACVEIALLATRALWLILDYFPMKVVPQAVEAGLLRALCGKLLEIEYMDIAELSFQILERIVTLENELILAQNRRILVQENGLVALLQFVDFFPLEIQRCAVRIVRELCTEYGFDDFVCRTKLPDGMQNLVQLLNSSDLEIQATACEAIQRLSESPTFGHQKPFVCQHVAAPGICDALVQIFETHLARSETLEDFASSSSAMSASENLSAEKMQHQSVLLTSILQFFRQIIGQLCDVDDQSERDATPVHLVQLCTTQLPPMVTRLMALEAQHRHAGDTQVIHETLKLVIQLLPWSIKRLAAAPSECTPPELSNHWARYLLPLVFRVCDLTNLRELRHDCLQVVHGSLTLLLASHQVLDQAVPVSMKEAFQLSAFLARMLRPSLADRSQNDARNVVLALEIVQSALRSHRVMFLGLFERCGVAKCVTCIADKSLCSDWFDPHVSYRSEEALDQAVASATQIMNTLPMEELHGAEGSRLKNIVHNLQASLVDCTKLKSALSQLFEFVDQTRRQKDSEIPALSPFELHSSGLTKVLVRLLQHEQVTQVLKHQFLCGVSWEFVLWELVDTLQQAISCEKSAFFVEEKSPEQVLKEFERLVQHLKVRVLIDKTKQPNESKKAVSPNRTSSSSSSSNSSSAGATTQSMQLLLANRRRRRFARLHDTIVLVEPLARVETMEEFVNEKLFGGAGSHATRSSGNDEADEPSAVSSSMMEEEKEQESHHEQEVQSEDPVSVEAPRTSSPPPNTPDRPERKVLAFYQNKQLDGGRSLLEAIFRTEMALRDTKTGRRAPHSWHDFHWPWTKGAHDITFRVVASAGSSKAIECNKHAELDEQADESSVLYPQWGWWDDAWDLILALKLVREHLLLLRYWRTSARSLAVVEDSEHSKVLADKGFVNEFLSAQLNRVLQAPLVVVMHLIPAWCFRVLGEFGFCVQFETKYHYMFATSCGLPRAIQHLSKTLWKQMVKEADMSQLRTETNPPIDSLATNQSTTGTESGTSSTASTASSALPARPSRRRDLRRPRHSSNSIKTLENLMRIIKLPRLKVRVSRAKVLASAMKLLEIYGGQKALIEVEFLGEVGTGLGPTTEFFTITCAEIQARDLELWRDEDVREQPSGSSSKPVEANENDTPMTEVSSNSPSIPVKGYHRIAVYWCRDCTRIEFPHCQEHGCLLTVEARHPDDPEKTIPQCSGCRARRDFVPEFGHPCAWCTSSSSNEQDKGCQLLRWWILSEEEVQYLKKVYPRDKASLALPVLQCAHCATVNFPGTVAGIVVLQDGDRMISKSGRRMYERDYRSVTKHVSPLCEGTPLKQLNCLVRREQVDLLVDLIGKSSEVLENEIDAFEYMAEAVNSSKEGKHASSCGSSMAFEPVKAPYGLYPRPLVPECDQLPQTKCMTNRVVDYFQFLGCFVAQALLDERLLNLPLSTTFFRHVTNRFDHLDQDLALGCFYVHEMDPVLGKSLQYLYDVHLQLARAQEMNAKDMEQQVTQQIESMMLDFTLIGNPHIELLPEGSTQSVTSHNLVQYLQLNVEFVLVRAIARQVQAFRNGFDALLACRVLRWFELDELALLFYDGDQKPLWTSDQLQKFMVCDHGFTSQSVQIHWLIKILCELTKDEQRLFLRFVTGADRLPLGGLQALEPHLTVVRKLSPPPSNATEQPVDDDQVLPSASTCTNYLKLPAYSSEEVMQRQLRYCIHEGQFSFHLS